ncbi:TetR/AcrR family transcriptional regulator [Planomicrobium sp. YIM 101495]|uniref:TetR/AcrR family transcriptional regulator n=1 Tax=Planomicrobium sp. YIM 101495 TaxID=2665160 RepID=UPI0012B7BEC7|nr:TetR-like C-terminal domain-containing protein [Planomicrobium sp. YIM 101495]MTD29517.1 TetR/AcrR family transcriptional regulator [Planomicrobium sp. YIM 101495]
MDLRVLKTKEALRNALLLLLKEKQLGAISVTEICKVAMVNRGTFYSHYGRVEDLFEEYFKKMMEDLGASYEEPYKHMELLKAKELKPKSIRIFHHIEKYQPFYRIVFSKGAPLSYYYLFFDHIQTLMQADMEKRHRATIDIPMVSAYQANAIVGLAIEWYRQDFQQTAEEMNETFVRILRGEE